MSTEGFPLKVPQGAAAAMAAALGDALGRPVTGLTGPAATLRVASSDAAVGFMTPPLQETDTMRQAMPGTPSAATMVGLTLVEAALCGPDVPEELVEDTLRRLAALGTPRISSPHGQLLAPSPVLTQVLKEYAQGVPFLSCGSQHPDATLLTAAIMLGAAQTEMKRAALILRAVSRHPIALDAAVTLCELTRQASEQQVTADALVKTARQIEERVYALLPSLPGTLAGPPEMGHGAMAMALARAQSSISGVDALLALSQDVSSAPDVLLCAVLGALMVEPAQTGKHVATVLRHGGLANTACSVVLGLTAALQGLQVIPLGWMSALSHGTQVTHWLDATCAGGKAHLPRPSSDLCWRWAREESAFRSARDVARQAAPAAVKTEQLGLF